MAQALSAGAGRYEPVWDEQIVPTLRQRLQNESAELSSRLSQASFPDDPDAYAQPNITSGPSGMASTSSRQRTTSTPLGISAPLPSRIPQPSAYRAAHAQLTGANGAQRAGGQSKSNPPIRPTGSRQNSTGSTSSQNHARRAAVKPATSSGVRSAPMSRENSSGPSGSKHLQPNPDRGQLTNRDSFDLSSNNLPDVSIRNELPPFRMDPQEAMRIAQRGHVREDDGDSSCGAAQSEEEDGFVNRSKEGYRSRRADGFLDDVESPRKRSESMSPVAGMPSSSRPSGSAKAAAGAALTSLGKGKPSSRAGSVPKRNATGPSSKPLSSSTSRSASHNAISSSTSSAPASRIAGVAAHLVPPESSFTPPKDANWDDVVIPAVAKKMALSSSPTRDASFGLDGDELAVEWDKDGVPIKWAKPGGSGSMRARPGVQTGMGGDRDEDGPSGSTITTKSGSAFSPTFDPSPGNPMNAVTGPSHGARYPAPPLGVRQDQNVNYDTTMRQYGLGSSSVPPSPAPFAHYGPTVIPGGKENLSPHLQGHGAAMQHQQSYASIRSAHLSAALAAHTGPSRQASHASMRHQASYHSMAAQSAYTGQVRDTPNGRVRGAEEDGGDHGWQEYPTPPRSGSRVGQKGPEGVPVERGKGTGKGKREGEHGKGCGCVIM